MNKQQIKEAAAKASEDYMENALIMSGPRGSYRKGFIAGAEWRINAVWHDASEDPEREDEPILVEYRINEKLFPEIKWSDPEPRELVLKQIKK